ncbi:phosphotransferase [Microlunatus sp. GCM10028923]|uniref:phosphotransferase n=1 Tax=Microlunatus sp. GCM10028923 TaxID=3273400 RepID=UPI003616B369
MPRRPVVDSGRLARWCAEQLGSPPADELFRSGHLSVVVGLRLADGREVVVKIRPDAPRIAACVDIQRRMFQAGYPCPRPLTGAVPFGGELATAEAYVPGGAMLPGTDDPAASFAEALAWLIRLAPRPGEVPALDPAPSWNHGGDELWPRSEEDPDADLNQRPGASWIDEVGRRARDRLRVGGSDVMIGHGDWLAGNLRWNEDSLLVVHDWDSMIVESEDVLVGFAAALYSTGGGADERATVEETERFLDAYGRARGRKLDADELQRAWAAGLWTLAYDAKYQHTVGQPVTVLTERQAGERLRRAGLRTTPPRRRPSS